MHCIVGCLVVASNVAGFLIVNHDPAGQQDQFYDKPYTRISPFIIGLSLGALLRDTKLKETKLSSPVAFVLMTAAICLTQFITYIDYTRFHGGNSWDNADVAAYYSFARLGFNLGVAVILLLCITNNGGFVLTFLNFPFWEVFGKLTYAAYLLHPAFLRMFYYQHNYLFQPNTIDYTVVIAGIGTLSYFFAAVLYVMVELPFANLVKLIF